MKGSLISVGYFYTTDGYFYTTVLKNVLLNIRMSSVTEIGSVLVRKASIDVVVLRLERRL